MKAGQQFEALLAQIGDGVPDSAQYRTLSNLTLDVPEARLLVGMDPFSPEYRPAAMALYLSLRGRADQGYLAARDEAPAAALPANLWTGLVPWSFADAGMVSEHLFAWGHILRHLNLEPGGSVLEYGPGSGQMLLSLSRMGYSTHGVDIDSVALDGIRAQSTHLGLGVQTERAEFGGGFDGQRFDAILFYESFHHAFEFEALLAALHQRLNPGGRIVLCGEPVVSAPVAAVPYPWGPRLDALSVFCMRRFGWMELGFTHDYLVSMATHAGWTVKFHRFRPCSRASLYVLQPIQGWAGSPSASPDARAAASWRRTAPLRSTKLVLARAKRMLRPS